MSSDTSVYQNIWDRLARIDLRTLALFRIGLALVFLIDLSTFWPHLHFFLSDDGLYPRQYAMVDQPQHAFSLFMISGKAWVMHVLFVISALAALALLFGYYTRIASVVCWLMISSLGARTIPYLSGADMQLNVLSFWAMFLPLGARFSIDQALSRTKPEQDHIGSLSTIAILLQVSYLYFIGALLKTGAAWHTDMNAVQAAITNIQFTTPFSYYLAQFPMLTTWLTYYVYYLEFYVVFLIFFPFYTQQCRLVAFILLATLHIGFGIFLDVSFFPLISLVAVTLFVPSIAWDWLKNKLEKRMRSADHAIYYDEPCEFCRKTCLIFRELSLLFYTRIETAQSDPAMHEILKRENSWIVKLPDGSHLLRFEAVAYVWRRSPLLWPLGVLFMPSFMQPAGRKLYDLIATNRGNLGKLTAYFLRYRECVYTRPSLMNLLVVAPLVSITLIMNIKTMKEYRYPRPPEIFPIIMDMTRLWQRWDMFAPYPSTVHLWVNAKGELKDGSTVDLLKDHWRTSRPADGRPRLGMEAFPTRRLHKFMSYFPNGLPLFVGRAFCIAWRESGHPVPLERVTIIMTHQENRIKPGQEPAPVKSTVALDYSCSTQMPKY